MLVIFFFFQAEDGIRDLVRSRGLGDVYKRQAVYQLKRGTYPGGYGDVVFEALDPAAPNVSILNLLADFAFYSGVAVSYTHLTLPTIYRCRRSTLCRSRWSPYH